MKKILSLILRGLIAALFFCVPPVYADYHVAQTNQTPEYPYTNWSTAASNIQDALDAAGNGATVWVDAGVYFTPTNAVAENVVYITNSLTLRSVGGAETTIIDGGGSNRCVFINLPAAAGAEGPAIMDGFTLTNGYTGYGGGGIRVLGSSGHTGVVQNCIITGNTLQRSSGASDPGGGGIHAYGTAFNVVISNCVIRANRTILHGTTSSSGGGLFARYCRLFIFDSIFEGNESCHTGGGLFTRTTAAGGLIDRCVFINNTSVASGGAMQFRDSVELRNLLVAGNTAGGTGGHGLYIYAGTLDIYNSTFHNSLVVRTADVPRVDIHNSILLAIGGNISVMTGYNNCLPEEPTTGEWHNTIVTTNNPDYIGFIDPAGGNFRLRHDSPCVNAGTNRQDWLAESLDLDRRRRIDRFSGIPDIGCLEYIPRGTFYGIR